MEPHFIDIAWHCSVDSLSREPGAIPFARYAPIRMQLLNLKSSVNQARSSQGFDAVPIDALKLRRTPARVFSADQQKSAADEKHS